MEYLKAWLWTQQKIVEKGGTLLDPVLFREVSALVENIESIVNTGFVEKSQDGKNYVMAEISAVKMETKILKNEILIARELLKNSRPCVSTMLLHEWAPSVQSFFERTSHVEN